MADRGEWALQVFPTIKDWDEEGRGVRRKDRYEGGCTGRSPEISKGLLDTGGPSRLGTDTFAIGRHLRDGHGAHKGVQGIQGGPGP